MPEPIVIARYLSPAEAHQLRMVLESAGIFAVVHGEQSSSQVGIGYDVRLAIPKSEVARATKVLREARVAAAHTGPAWFCGACEEVIDEGFEVCWSCGNSKEEVHDPSVDVAGIRTASEHVSSAPLNEMPVLRSNVDPHNPYAAPTTTSIAGNEAAKFSEEHQRRLRRAWRGAVLGLMFLPPVILNLYSCYLLLTLASSEAWPPQMSRLYWATWIINLAASGLCLLVLGIA